MRIVDVARRRNAVERLYKDQFGDLWHERRMLSALAFGITFGVTRAVTHALKGGGGSGGIEIAGRHIHHLTFGILGLLGSGYAMVEGLGVRDPRRHRNRSRALAALYGASAALTLDEFALWLDLEDDYWSDEGRKSVDAVVGFGNLLALTAVSKDFPVKLVRTLRTGAPQGEFRNSLKLPGLGR